MQRMLHKVYAGISGHLDNETNKYKFTVDFDNNSNDDVIKFISPYFSTSSIDDNTYWFGYSFNDGQSNPRRDEFIAFMKNVQVGKLSDPDDEWSDVTYTDDSIKESDLSRMIVRSLNNIRLNEYDIDCVVYPESKSGNLVKMIARCIRQYASNSRPIEYAELKKANPSDIDFDYVGYAEDCANGVVQVPDYVDDEYIANMIRKARASSSFSLRKCIKPVVLRNYVSNFYKFDSVTSPIFNAQVVLIIDDFGTTGTTIREMVRNVRKINSECEIYIFTLMGKQSR